MSNHTTIFLDDRKWVLPKRNTDQTRLSFFLKVIVSRAILSGIFMFFTLFSYGLLVIFYAAFFGLTSIVLSYFIALALILTILTASTLIDIQENTGAKVK